MRKSVPSGAASGIVEIDEIAVAPAAAQRETAGSARWALAGRPALETSLR
jgi:hypothetical protein